MSDHDTPPPPPPPENDAFTPQEMFERQPEFQDQPLDTGKPQVAANPTRVFVVLGGMIILLVYLLYSIFFSASDKAPDESIKAREIADSGGRATAPAPPPPLEEEELPEAPPLEPPSIPEPTQLPEIQQEQDNANNKALLDRLKSNMMVLNGGAGLFGGSDAADNAEDELAGMDPNAQFGRLVVRSNTKAAKVTATHIGDLRRVIAQGRLIYATLETAINTDLPGPIRAIVSRDTYGEAGNTPLIPKGSRLIGQYNSNIIAGQSRVYVMWTRVIRPDGVDVALGSPLIDQIGQAGVGGYVDNKFREMFSRAVLASVFSIAVAAGVEQIEDPKSASSSGTTNIITGGGLGSSGNGGTASEASINALNRLGSLTSSFISKFLNVKPTILVDQGTPVFVFVNRDLIFPADLVGVRTIQ